METEETEFEGFEGKRAAESWREDLLPPDWHLDCGPGPGRQNRATCEGLPIIKTGAEPDAQPTGLIDTREQIPLVFTRLPSATTMLWTGDSLAGAQDLFAVERKSIPDLV